MTDLIKNFNSFYEATECPKCHSNWNDGDIYEKLRSNILYKDWTDEEVIKGANSYGWTKEKPIQFKRQIGIELPYNDQRHYDGVSYWQCPDCKTTWDAFTGEEEKIVDVTNLPKIDNEDYEHGGEQ